MNRKATEKSTIGGNYLGRLEKIRQSLNLNKGQMAELMGITATAYSNYFSDKENPPEPSFSTICNLAKKITADDLFYLLTGERSHTVSFPKETSILEDQIFEAIHHLPPSSQVVVHNLVGSLHQQLEARRRAPNATKAGNKKVS